MIKKVFGFLLHPVLLTVLALLVIGLLVWWIGPLVAIGTWTPLVSAIPTTSPSGHCGFRPTGICRVRGLKASGLH